MAEFSSKESLELIKELLEVSLHCITYIRNIFDKCCYEDSMYTVSREYVVAQSIRTDSLSVSSVKTKKLLRGKSSSSDLFLDWIDGIFEGIDRKIVTGVQVSISANENHDIHEFYVFNIDYDNTDVLVASQYNLHSHNETSRINCQLRVRNTIRNLLLMTQNLNPLPFKKLVAIKILVNDKYYQPPETCFYESRESEIRVSPAILTKNIVKEFGNLSTGTHSLAFKGISKFSDDSEGLIFPDDCEEDDLVIDPFNFFRDEEILNVESHIVPVTTIDFGEEDSPEYESIGKITDY